MAYRNPPAMYQNTKVNTASPAELTLMLYDGAVKFTHMAIMALEKGDLEQCHNNVQKAKKIIVEFRSTLNFDYEVAKDFDRVYDYIYWTLVQGNMKKDKDMLEEALKRIKEMRDTRKEVMEKNKASQKNA